MSPEINRGYFNYVTHFKQRARLFRALSTLIGFLRALSFIGVVLYSLFLWVVLRISRIFYQHRITAFAREAADLAPEFSRQYPFHFYPVLAKAYCLQLAREALRDEPADARILEVAAGEGSFSGRIFSGLDLHPVALDINPYSLVKCAAYGHFSRRIVADCLRLPVQEGFADILFAMNFLHHVSHKKETLTDWSRAARKIIFSENTPYWASASVPVFLLGKIGFRKKAEASAAKIERREMQSLKPARELDALVNDCLNIGQRQSFLSEFPFFLCNVSAALMLGVYGPPTPAIVRFLSRGVLMSLATATAKELFYLDSVSDRSKDAFIFYSGESRPFRPSAGKIVLKCPDCGAALRDDKPVCVSENKEFQEKDGMLFLLSGAGRSILENYDTKTARLTASEHL